MKADGEEKKQEGELRAQVQKLERREKLQQKSLKTLHNLLKLYHLKINHIHKVLGITKDKEKVRGTGAL